MSRTFSELAAPPGALAAHDAALPTSSVCPSCGRPGAQPFFSLPDVPRHSCVLVPERAAAIAYPRGHIELACCGGCGFVFNARFTEDDSHYASNYEETQGFSPTFARFARGLAERLTETYELHGKTVLEVGCGKGEFLSLMVEAGAARGIGFDPSFVPGRLESPVAGRLEFRKEYFTAQTPPMDVDFICCRHTLEHIADTRTFMSLLREYVAGRPHAHVFVEVPDFGRINREAAFWDVFHEHCSYFDGSSLAALFRCAGLDVVESWLDYDDQYLMIVGRPAEAASRCNGAVMNEALDQAHDFAARVQQEIDRWRDLLRSRATAGQRVAVWGSGSKCVGLLTALGFPATDEIGCIVDINPHRHGKYMPAIEQPIVAPSALVEYDPHLVIILNPIYRGEIAAELERLGLTPEITAL